jgi:hypothetical protein
VKTTSVEAATLPPDVVGPRKNCRKNIQILLRVLFMQDVNEVGECTIVKNAPKM